MPDAELAAFLTGFHSTASALESRIIELESHDYPTLLSKQLLSVFRNTIRESAKIVDELRKDPGEDPKRIMRHGHLLSWIHQSVHLVSRSLGSDVPHWAIQPMKYEIARYLEEPVDILIVGGDEGGNFAYDYRLDELRKLLEGALGSDLASKLMSDLPAHMVVFHFPFGERDNVLAHGAFFHEVGHQIDREIRGISLRVGSVLLKKRDASIREAARAASEKAITEAFGTAASEGQRSLDDEKTEVIREAFVKQIQFIVLRWSMEFCADLIATKILGPAYALVVIHSPVLLGSLRLHSDSHPATMLRLKAILDLLCSPTGHDYFTAAPVAMQSAGFMDLLKGWQAKCDGTDYNAIPWHRGGVIGGNPALKEHTIKLALELADQTRLSVQEEIQEGYSPQQFTRDMEDLIPVLRAGITINERVDCKARKHEVTPVSSIFNVGWSCYLHEPAAEHRERLQKLLRKSVELSQIQTMATT